MFQERARERSISIGDPLSNSITPTIPVRGHEPYMTMGDIQDLIFISCSQSRIKITDRELEIAAGAFDCAYRRHRRAHWNTSQEDIIETDKHLFPEHHAHQK